MRILYIATDVDYPHSFGGSRRVLETARNLQTLGHKVVTLTSTLSGTPLYDDSDGFPSYRMVPKDPILDIRIFIHKLKSKKNSDKKIPLSRIESHFTRKSDIRTWKKVVRDLFRHEIPIHKLIRTFQFIPLTLKIIRKHKIDLILERGASYGVGAIASILTNRPYFVDFIDVLYWRFALLRARGIFSYITDIQVPSYIDRAKIHVVKVTVDPDKFSDKSNREKIRKELKIKPDEIVLGYVGTMYTWHGLDYILDAVKILKSEKFPVKALLIGDGEYYSHIKERVISEELESDVIMTGRVPFDDIANYMSCIDIALSMNTASGMGLKNMEYMAMGIPQICANVDVISLVVRNMKEGLIIPKANVNALVTAIKKLIQDEDLRKRLGNNAKKRVLEEFTWKQHARNLIKGFKT